MTDYRGLGFDPAAGSADAVMTASERCARAADSAPVFHQDTTGWWTGAAAGAYGDRLTGVPAELSETQQVLRAAADVLAEWAGTLLANQREAERLDRRAIGLRRAIRDATDELDSTTTVAQFSITPDAEDARRRAASRHHELTEQLAAVLDEARLLENNHLAAARRVAERIRALDTGGVQAAAHVPDRADLFGGLTAAVAMQSAFASELAGVLLKPRGPVTEPVAGAASAFRSALTG
ncbi:MAG: hypothetical protein ABW224_12550 [Kibdelosporangium sp.]